MNVTLTRRVTRSLLAFTALTLGLGVASPVSAQATDGLEKPDLAEVDSGELLRMIDQARRHIAEGDSKEALALLDHCIHSAPRMGSIYYLRARERFRVANIPGAYDDFHQLIQLVPQRSARLWERGITCYYAEKYVEGVQQFAGYQTVDSTDVENAVWHFLCNVPVVGVEKARASMLPIKGDIRVPMKEIYDLYRGVGSAKAVMAATDRDASSADNRQLAKFYAHLYLGLYDEALGRPRESLRHMGLAAGEYRINHFMGDVARVHLQLRAKQPPQENPSAD